MKKLLVTMLVLALGVLATAQQPTTTGAPAGQPQAPAAGQGTGAQAPTAGQATTGQPAGAAQPQQKKEIKDPAEYNAYVSAIQNPDANQKIAGLEDFLNRYPNSVVKVDALEVLMAAYQQAQNGAKTTETAQKLIAADPTNVRALALLAYQARSAAEQGQNAQQNLQHARTYGEQGLQALQTMAKPEGMNDAQFAEFKAQTQIIFDGALGFAAFNQKDYPTAQRYLQDAVNLRLKVNSGDPTNIRDIYPLALSYLEPTPIQPIGLFWIARAAAMSGNNPQIVSYGRAKYVKYHGGEDGWNELLQTAGANPAPPANFAVKPAPTVQEQAAILANSGKDVKQMSIAEWELILGYGDPAIRDRVWAQIQQLPAVAFVGQVIAADKNTVQLAATADAIEANRADVVVTMNAPIPAARMPQVGKQIPIQAKPSAYTPNPFVLQMTDGMLGKAATKPAAKKPAARRRR